MAPGTAPTGAPRRERWGTPIVVGLVALELTWIAFVLLSSTATPSFGLDYRWHMDAARRLLDTGSPYWPWQVSAPYEIANGAILYPPTAFVLFVAFLPLPPVLWWVVPIGITAYAMHRHRPPDWLWPIAIGCFTLEKSLNVYVFGNPSMWIVAAIAAGTVWHWPFVFVIAKPTFAPVALLGATRRSWWMAAAIIGVVSLVSGALWVEWVAVVRNSNVSILYNVPTLPLILAPLILAPLILAPLILWAGAAWRGRHG